MPALEVTFPSGPEEHRKKNKKKVLVAASTPLEHPTSEKKKKREKRVAEEEEGMKGQAKDVELEMCPSKRKSAKSVVEEPGRKRAKKKNWGSDEDEESSELDQNPNAVSNFNISEMLREKLKSKGIESLFPIQAMTFEIIFNGCDLVGRARTGQGKTLAFVLPILESLTSGRNKAEKKTGYGRAPSVIVLAPTRELAKQVHADFEFYGGAVGLSTCCVYGGSPYGPQEHALRRGVDVVVGTPGRIKDLIERGCLDLKSLKFRVLDEADEMLNMGFVDDVENILGRVEDASKVQTLLFSATIPDWVKKIASKFFKPDRKTADLVGDDKMKASASVKHIVLPCFHSARAQVIPDVIRCYSSGGRTIVFTETKNAASELAGSLPGSARALHGDIQQSQREVTLAGFRSGKFSILVATDVAARGLDINDVQLIIQCEPPRDVETYIHRSGRTGRAGNTGISVVLYDRKKEYMISQIERQAGVKFERVSAPQPADVPELPGLSAAESIMNVTDRQSAEHLVNNGNVPAVDIIAKALAKIAGYTEVKKRSLLTSQEDSTTLILQSGKTMYTPSYAFNILRRFLPEETLAGIRSMSLTADGTGAVFDVPNQHVDLFLAGQENADMVNIEVLKTLPELQVRDDKSRGGGGRGGFTNGHGRGGRGNYSNGKSWGGGGRGRQQRRW